jgi:hypothetical protein
MSTVLHSGKLTPLLFVGSLCLGAWAPPELGSSTIEPGAFLCIFNRAELLALDEYSFDQDMNRGWRAVARHEECTEIAADLIRDYRETRGLKSTILYWHEGQLRAIAGSTDEAIRLFEKSRRTFDVFGWNLYVDASIAFLKHDKPALLAAREALARLPRPEGFDPRDEKGNVINTSWPLNLSFVDGFITCFDREYKEAYGNCR